MKLYFAVLSFLVPLAVLADQNQTAAYEKEVLALLPEFRTVHPKDDFTYKLRDESGQELGVLYLEDAARFPRKVAYGGEIEVGVITDPAGKIIGVVTGRHEETPSYMKRLTTLKFFQRWNKLTLKEARDRKIDSVTRATYSSEAIIHGVRSAARTALGEERK